MHTKSKANTKGLDITVQRFEIRLRSTSSGCSRAEKKKVRRAISAGGGDAGGFQPVLQSPCAGVQPASHMHGWGPSNYKRSLVWQQMIN